MELSPPCFCRRKSRTERSSETELQLGPSTEHLAQWKKKKKNQTVIIIVFMHGVAELCSAAIAGSRKGHRVSVCVCVRCCKAFSQPSSIWRAGALAKEGMVLMMQCSRYRGIAHITHSYWLTVKQEWFPAYKVSHSFYLRRANYSSNSVLGEGVFVWTVIKVGLADRYFFLFVFSISVWTFWSCQQVSLRLIQHRCFRKGCVYIYMLLCLTTRHSACLSFFSTSFYGCHWRLWRQHTWVGSFHRL